MSLLVKKNRPTVINEGISLSPLSFSLFPSLCLPVSAIYLSLPLSLSPSPPNTLSLFPALSQFSFLSLLSHDFIRK